MPKVYLFVVFFLLISVIVFAQKEDVNWAFGNGCGINFENPGEPTIFLSNAANSEASASISDTSGQLQFYLADNTILNQNNDPLVNGEDIKDPGTYARGMVILPFFKGSHMYHIFHVGKADNGGIGWGFERLYHSIVDMSLGEGKGEVVLKNDLLLDESINEGISVVKHGDGKSWWLTVHENGKTSGTHCTQKFFKYLINGESISGPFIQEIGTPDCNRDYPGGQTKFFASGNLMIYMDYFDGITELFDFDRCSGELSNPISFGTNFPAYGAETSSDGHYLYITDTYTQGGSNSLYQYDLLAKNIPASRETLAVNPAGTEILGQLLLAPNGKIYLSSGPPSSFPDHLSVINHPELPGLDCGLSPLSFYLGEDSYTFGDLPNMPNYNLPQINDGTCATEVKNVKNTNSKLHIYPNPATDYLFFDIDLKSTRITVFDILGNIMLSMNSLNSSNSIDISGLSDGIYSLTIFCYNQPFIIKRFIKQH